MSLRVRNGAARPGELAPAPAAPAAPAAVPPADEAREVAREVAGAFARQVQSYIEDYKLTAQEAVARAGADDPAALEHARTAAPHRVDWHHLDQIGRHDPDAALRRWGEVKAAARGELRAGGRAARAVGFGVQTAWSRAQFLAVRDGLVESFRPRRAAEFLLIDQVAVFQAELWSWQATVSAYAAVADLGRPGRREGQRHEPPRLSDAGALERAAAMVEQSQRMFNRALAALQALQSRRRQRAAAVRQARRVAIGSPQLNLVGSAALTG